MRPPAPLPADLRDRCFSIGEARALGVTPGRLRFRDLAVPSRSVRVPGTSMPAPLTLARTLLSLYPGTVVTHTTAALWCGLPLPARLGREVHLTVPAGAGVPAHIRRRGVIAHRLALRDGDVRQTGSWRVTSPERTFLDLAAHLTVDELVCLGDAAVCAHTGGRPSVRRALTTPEALDARCRTAHGRGARTARTALSLVRVGSDSAPETRLRLALVRAGLPEPALDVTIRLRAGMREIYPDLAYVEHRICVQYDGGHHADPRQHRLDIERADVTARAGWLEVRISADDLRIMVDHRRGWVPRAVAKVDDAIEHRKRQG